MSNLGMSKVGQRVSSQRNTNGLEKHPNMSTCKFVEYPNFLGCYIIDIWGMKQFPSSSGICLNKKRLIVVFFQVMFLGGLRILGMDHVDQQNYGTILIHATVEQL